MKSDANLQIPSQKPSKALPPHWWGNTPIAKWVLFDKLTSYSFIKPSQIEEQGNDNDNDEEEEEEQEGEDSWGFECLSPRLESS